MGRRRRSLLGRGCCREPGSSVGASKSRAGRRQGKGLTKGRSCPPDTGHEFVTTCLSSRQPVFLLGGLSLPGDRTLRLRARGHRSWDPVCIARSYLCIHSLIYLPYSCHFILASALCHFQVACLLPLGSGIVRPRSPSGTGAGSRPRRTSTK